MSLKHDNDKVPNEIIFHFCKKEKNYKENVIQLCILLTKLYFYYIFFHPLLHNKNIFMLTIVYDFFN